jgi:hypothetical protein
MIGMGQTYLTGWGVQIIPQRPTGKVYVGRITNLSKNWKYVEYNPFYASTRNFWVKVPKEFRHELVGANRVKVVRDENDKYLFHSAWYEDPKDGRLPLGKAVEKFTALGGGY